MANYSDQDGLRYYLAKLKLLFAQKSDVPTKVSELTNDSGYVTSTTAPVTSVNSKTGAVSLSASDVSAIASPSSPKTGDILSYNGTNWVASDAPETGVITFNSRSGAVTPQTGDYTAAMVGARADTWMPTASDVGARPSDWLPTTTDIGAVATTSVGSANGVCPLGADAKVSSTYLPSYVDDVIEAYTIDKAEPLTAEWLTLEEGSTSPLTPEKGKIYLILSAGDYQNMEYRWGTTQYVKIADSGLTPMTNAQIDEIFEED